jgi:hypothetical protein
MNQPRAFVDVCTDSSGCRVGYACAVHILDAVLYVVAACIPLRHLVTGSLCASCRSSSAR